MSAQPKSALITSICSKNRSCSSTIINHAGAGIGSGLVLIGAAYGIGRLASSALEGTARQPEAANTIRTTMIIAAALIEGFTFFALVVTFMLATKAPIATPVEKPAAEQTVVK